jgi:hypothetical protein
MSDRSKRSSDKTVYATTTPLDPDYDPEIIHSRIKRFFGDGGLCALFEKLGDPLVQFDRIVEWLESTGLNRSAIIARFRFSVEYGGFGWHGTRRRVKNLLDLDSYGSSPPGRYRLHPRSLEAQMFPRLMRARASVWVEWLKHQGWPVPIELTSMRSNNTTAAPPQAIEQQPKHTGDIHSNNGEEPSRVEIGLSAGEGGRKTLFSIHPKYLERVKSFSEQGKLPPLQKTKGGVQGDREWAVEHSVSRSDVESWRKELNLSAKVGRPNSAGNSANSAGK